MVPHQLISADINLSFLYHRSEFWHWTIFWGNLSLNYLLETEKLNLKAEHDQLCGNHFSNIIHALKCFNFRLTIHCPILSIHFTTSYYKFNLAWVLSKRKGYYSTYLYKSKAAKHPMLFETAVDGRYCELHFPKQRIKKSHHNTCPFGNKINKKIVHQITEIIYQRPM